MGLIQQSIQHFLSGVSQQPPSMRLPTHAAEMVNCVPHPAYGLMKRPPSVRQGSLGAPLDPTLFMHTINRDADSRYRVTVNSGGISVHDAVTGAALPVSTPNGIGYLQSSTDPESDFRAVTIGDTTYILNRRVVVKQSARKSSAARNEALVAIRAADFATTYSVTLDGHTTEYVTPDGATPHDRSLISTDYIATQLSKAILAGDVAGKFAVTQYGSTLHVSAKDGSDFSISASDGLADTGILAIKGGVQRFDDLPDRAKKGFTVAITGDPSSQFDDYYVTYDDNGSPNLAGVWRETVRPDVLTDLDATTMPWQLSLAGVLIDGEENATLPAPPTVADDDSSVSYAGWTKSAGPGFVNHDPNVQVTLNEQLEGFSSILAALNGHPAVVRCNFDVNTQAVTNGATVEVQLLVSNYASTGNVPVSDFTTVWTRQYKQGLSLFNEFVEYPTSAPQNTQFMLRLNYLDGVTPATNKMAAIRLHTFTSDDKCSIVITSTTARLVTFDPDAVYPVATVFFTTTDGIGSQYVTTGDMTGAQVAAAMTGAFANAGAVVTDTGVLRVTKAGSIPTVAVRVWLDAAIRFWNLDMQLIPQSLIGKTIKNLSDGSTGTVTDNTATQIIVAGGLHGGGANVFAPGDLCEVVSDGASFTFSPAVWKSRTVGDLTSNPFPSFVNRTLSDVFFFRNRLGVLAGQNVILSRAGDYRNFFRKTATQLLPDDVIDVQSAQQQASHWHSALQWGETLVLWCDEGQYALVGEPALSPQSVGIKPLTQFLNSRIARPVVAGRRAFFARSRNGATQVFEYAVVNQTGTPDAEDCTTHVPTYIRGNPIQMVGDGATGVLIVRTDDAPNVLYVQHFHFDNQAKVQEAWHKWTFAAGAEILAMDLLDGLLGLAVRRSGTTYLETINLVVPPTDEAGSYLDGRTGTSGAYVGDVYESRIDLTTIFLRQFQRFGNTEPTTSGRLTLRYLRFKHHDTRSLSVTVTRSGATPVVYAYSNPAAGDDDSLRVPVMAPNTGVTVSLGNTSSDGFRVSGCDWEATYTSRGQRI